MAKTLAGILDYAYLDTGAVYRALALAVLINKQDPNDLVQIKQTAKNFAQNFTLDCLTNPELRTQEVSDISSQISVHPDIRKILIEIQRSFAHNPPDLPPDLYRENLPLRPAKGAILDGRDIGTIICPEAPIKFFITADEEIRAQRRTQELQSKQIPATYEAVLAQGRVRDKRDMNRKTAPLKPAQDAYVIDTSYLSPEEVVKKALVIVRQRLDNFAA